VKNNNCPLNIRFVAKTSDIRNFPQNIRSDVKTSEVATLLRTSSPVVQMQLKMYFFVPFVRPCVYHNCGGISESHACKDCEWHIILDAAFYTTYPGERELVLMTHHVQYNIPTFEAVLRKNMHLLLERCRRSNNVTVACFDAVRLFIFFYILWTLQPHFYFVTECSDIAVFFVCLRVCMSQCIRTLPGLDQFRN